MQKPLKRQVQKRMAQEKPSNQEIIVPSLGALPQGKNMVRIDTLLSKATSPEGGVEEFYANHVQIGITANDVVLDFYRILPDTTSPKNISISLLQRTIIPLNMVKGLATALANSITQLEIDNNIKVPNLREPVKGEPIKIWE